MSETTSKPKLRIFVSYSHQPVENAEFVRALVARLDRSSFSSEKNEGFDVWLDEERIAGAEDVQDTLRKAISTAEAALFVANSRWWERERTWIRHEVALLARRPGTRLLLLLRESAIDADLDHNFTPLKRLVWYPDDPAPDARFWEVYCGLTGTPPGRRSEWEQRGQQVSLESAATSSGVAKTSAPESIETAPIKLNTNGKPVNAFLANDWAYLVTDQDEWVGVNAAGKLHPPIHSRGEFAAATITETDELLVAACDGTVARCAGTNWKILSQDSPVLCFASSASGDMAGTISGHILQVTGAGVSQALRVRDPVISIASCDGGLMVIGSRGEFGRAALPSAPGATLHWIASGDLGRPMDFFQAVDSAQVGVMGSTRIGVLEPSTGRLTLCPRSFDEGPRTVAFLGAQTWPYAVLTDAGSVTMVDAAVAATRPVRFPRGTVVRGCFSAVGRGSLLAWTQDGILYLISPEGIAEAIAEGGVVLAYTPAWGGIIDVVRWNPEQGCTVQSVRVS
jgi:hypothetical protein